MPEFIVTSKCLDYKVLYDLEDHELISQYNWYLNPEGYVFSKVNGRIIYIHRLVMKVIDRPDVEVDHRFHNKLDNRKLRLRICTSSQNKQNRRKVSPGTSNFKGCYFESDRALYHAQISFGNRTKNLGRFKSEKTAALAYDETARSVFGEFACLNFPGNDFPIQQCINYEQ